MWYNSYAYALLYSYLYFQIMMCYRYLLLAISISLHNMYVCVFSFSLWTQIDTTLSFLQMSLNSYGAIGYFREWLPAIIACSSIAIKHATMVFCPLFLYDQGKNRTHLPCYYHKEILDEKNGWRPQFFPMKRLSEGPYLKPSISRLFFVVCKRFCSFSCYAIPPLHRGAGTIAVKLLKPQSTEIYHVLAKSTIFLIKGTNNKDQRDK